MCTNRITIVGIVFGGIFNYGGANVTDLFEMPIQRSDQNKR